MNNINELNIKFDNDITLVIATIGENKDGELRETLVERAVAPSSSPSLELGR